MVERWLGQSTWAVNGLVNGPTKTAQPESDFHPEPRVPAQPIPLDAYGVSPPNHQHPSTTCRTEQPAHQDAAWRAHPCSTLRAQHTRFR
jgi:hypothetical protein